MSFWVLGSDTCEWDGVKGGTDCAGPHERGKQGVPPACLVFWEWGQSEKSPQQVVCYKAKDKTPLDLEKGKER